MLVTFSLFFQCGGEEGVPRTAPQSPKVCVSSSNETTAKQNHRLPEISKNGSLSSLYFYYYYFSPVVLLFFKPKNPI
jgi:hypothetical protein